MTWSLVGSLGTATQGSSGASITPGFGQTTTAGNLLVCWVTGISTTAADDTIPAAPSGWSTAVSQAAAGRCQAVIFYKVAVGSDSAPVIAAQTGELLAGQCGEFNWSVAGLVGTPDKVGGNSGTTTSPIVATASGADTQSGDLVLAAGGVEYSTAATKTLTHTLNNGATATAAGNNNGTSTREHYAFAYGITTGNSGADTSSLALTTTNAADSVVVVASFQAIVTSVNVSDSTITGEGFGVVGPILYEPINTAESVSVAITGGSTGLSVNVSDSTTTAESVAPLLVSFINASDSTTTGESVTVNLVAAGTLSVNVSDSTTTSSTGNAELEISFVNVSDSTTTAESVPEPNLPGFTYSVNVTDSTTTSNTPTVNPPSSDKAVSVSDSTTTSEFFVVAFDPPIIFTLEVDVSDSTTTTSTSDTVAIPVIVNATDSVTTGEILSENLTISVNVTDSVTTASTSVGVSIVSSGVLSVNVSDSTTTAESVDAAEGEPATAILQFTQVASDNFNRANGTLAGSNDWLAISTGSMTISSNEAVGAASSQLGDYRTSETYNSNQYSQFQVGSVALGVGDYLAATVRNQDNANNYLLLYFQEFSNQYTLQLYKKVSGSYTNLCVNALPGALPQGTTVTLVAEGNVLSSKVNNNDPTYAINQVAAIDSTFTGGVPGIESFGTATMDNWQGGDAATVAVGPALASDNFNRSDGTLSAGNANWALMNYPFSPATVELNIVSDQIDTEDPPVTAHAGDVRVDAIYNSDQWSAVDNGTGAMNSTGFDGVTIRNQGSGGTLGNSGYLGVNFENKLYGIYRLDNGASTLLAAADYPSNDPAGAAYNLVAQGSRVSLRVNGAEILAVDDGTYTGGQPGLMGFAAATMDNWSGGDTVDTDLNVTVSDSTTTGDSDTAQLSIGVNVSDSTATANTPTVQLVAAGTLTINVSDGVTTTNTPTVAPLVLPGVSVTDATTTNSTSVGVQIIAAGTLTVNVSDSISTTNTPSVAPLALPGVHPTESVTTGQSVAAQIVNPGAPPTICYPTSATLTSNSTTAALVTYTSSVAMGYESSVDIEDYDSSVSIGTCLPGHESMALRRARRRRRLHG